MWPAHQTEDELRCGYEALRLSRQQAGLACIAGRSHSTVPPFADALRSPVYACLVRLHAGMLARGIRPAPLPGIPFDAKLAAAGEHEEE